MKKLTALILVAALFSACAVQPAVTERSTAAASEITTEIMTTSAVTTAKITTAATTATEAATTSYTPPQLREPDMNFTYTGGIDMEETVYGIKDESLSERVNGFISEASEKLLARKDKAEEMCGYKELRLSYRISLANGYISVIVGYISEEMDSLHLGEKWYMCETAVFDIVSGEHITDFADLFVDGFDWEEAVEKDLRLITDVYYYGETGYDAQKALSGGFKFTAEKIIFPYGTFGNDGTELNFCHSYWFPFISQGCKSSIPRDYSEFVTGEVRTKAIAETVEYNTIIGGDIYGNRIAYSRVMTDAEIEKENALYEKIQSGLVSEYFTVAMDRRINTYFCTITKKGDFYNCYFGNFIDRLSYLYDSDGEKVTLSDLVNESFVSDFEPLSDCYEVAEIQPFDGGCYVSYYIMQEMDNQYGYEAVRRIELKKEEMSSLLLNNKEHLK